MSETMTEAEFKTWEVQQLLGFELVDRRPVRLPDELQGASRLARVRQLARKVLADEAAVTSWMGAPQLELALREPEALTSDSEEGCQLVLQALVALGRRREADGV